MGVVIKIFDWLIQYSLNSKNPSKEEQRNAKAFIFVWTSTVVIMWFYVWFSYTVYDFPTVAIIGLACTIIHTLAPVIYRSNKSLTLAGLNISITAFIFQITFCIFNGGIDSASAIWFTAHPVIMSFFADKRLIFVAVILNMLAVIGLTVLTEMHFFPPDALSKTISDWMRITSLIFLDIIIATYTIVFMNTTKQSEIELAKRNEMIENLMRIISHDINNALVVSTLTTSMLINDNEKKKLSEDQVLKRLQMIQNSNEQIKEISKSILQWMKAVDHNIKLDLEPLSLECIITHVQDSFAAILEDKSLNLEVDCPDDRNAKVLVDSKAFRNQVINNLISNAIKFSPKDGDITLKIRVLGDNVEFSIIDKGVGISESMIENLFDPSKSYSTRGTQGEKGTGFGLPIVKTLVTNMNGHISISSKQKSEEDDISGTTVTVKVPVAMS